MPNVMQTTNNQKLVGTMYFSDSLASTPHITATNERSPSHRDILIGFGRNDNGGNFFNV